MVDQGLVIHLTGSIFICMIIPMMIHMGETK